MSVLLLRLAGPLQAWGASSRFTIRSTELAPTKSGIIGLLAAAIGRRRTDPVEDLIQLRFGVRKDQPGKTIRDFHTAHTSSGTSMPLSNRYYLSDAIFVAGVEGDREVLERLDHHIRHPRYPLYLGRRSCPPTFPISLGVVDEKLEYALMQYPWQAHQTYRQGLGRNVGELEIVVDHDPVSAESKSGRTTRELRDVPISFDSRRREYDFRRIDSFWVDRPGLDQEKSSTTTLPNDDLDPMAALLEVSDVSDETRS